MSSESGFFFEFANGGVNRIFVGVKDAAGDFPGKEVCAEAVLVNEDEFVVGC